MEQLTVLDSYRWRRFQSGDPAAFSELYNRFFTPLFNYGYRFTSEAFLIEDAIQDLFLRLWKNRKTLQCPAHVSHYLFKAFRHHIVDKITCRDYREPLLPDIGDEDLVHSSREAEWVQNECREELCSRVYDGLMQLTPHQREAILLRYYKEKSYPEIADQFNLTQKGAYKLVGRAIAALRKSLPAA
jgi:RNA polymerase sigma factor (sigma-70 family)